MRIVSYRQGQGAALLFILAAAFLAAPPPATAATGPKVVMHDPGGALASRQREIRALRRSGQRVELRGTCYSSCTMYLGLNNVCVAPDAVLGFHGPHGLFGGLQRDVFEHWSQVMAAHLREPLRGWFLQHGRHIRHGVTTLRGSTLIGMGYARCDPPQRSSTFRYSASGARGKP
ncbi:hypothetical protein [Szabonella alba]|uniref:Uncharacterized protein n=1 Tax=Szabonella alba TaxID=2804194 RepID=A0A8K0VGH8_9RHOB|nr:hypothetical protein [Szabonella alba]MBL4919370.1 hypothetical protein [Szabonella alba]